MVLNTAGSRYGAFLKTSAKQAASIRDGLPEPKRGMHFSAALTRAKKDGKKYSGKIKPPKKNEILKILEDTHKSTGETKGKVWKEIRKDYWNDIPSATREAIDRLYMLPSSVGKGHMRPAQPVVAAAPADSASPENASAATGVPAAAPAAPPAAGGFAAQEIAPNGVGVPAAVPPLERPPPSGKEGGRSNGALDNQGPAPKRVSFAVPVHEDGDDVPVEAQAVPSGNARPIRRAMAPTRLTVDKSASAWTDANPMTKQQAQKLHRRMLSLRPVSTINKGKKGKKN